MKTIKYRAKRLDNDKWIEGSYLVHEGPLHAFYEGHEKGYQDKHFIVFTDFADWNMERRLLRTEVDPKTLGMFTGLIDLNHKEIYSGDIIKTGHEIKYRKAAKRYKLVQWVETKYKVGFNLGESNNATCEIVGNIHDNWDLLQHCK
jgi:uncharacterized phage protein (TIGR01671 family)